MANTWKPDDYMNSGLSKGAYLKTAPMTHQINALKKSTPSKKQNLKTENDLEKDNSMAGHPVG